MLRGRHRKFAICQTDHSIHPKLRIFPHSEVIHGSNTEAHQSLTKVKEKWSIIKLDVFVLSFIFFVPISQTMIS